MKEQGISTQKVYKQVGMVFQILVSNALSSWTQQQSSTVLPFEEVIDLICNPV